MLRMQTDGACGFEVLHAIVHEERRVRCQAESLEADAIDLRVRFTPADFTRRNYDIEPPLERSLVSQSADDLHHSVREHGRATSACAERRRDVPHLGPIIAPRLEVRVD